jgi:hypothetical protein
MMPCGRRAAARLNAARALAAAIAARSALRVDALAGGANGGAR